MRDFTFQATFFDTYGLAQYTQTIVVPAAMGGDTKGITAFLKQSLHYPHLDCVLTPVYYPQGFSPVLVRYFEQQAVLKTDLFS